MSVLLENVNDKNFKFVGFVLTSEGLDSCYEDLEKSLNDLKLCSGTTVLIDQLLSHGLKNERFASLLFDGKKLLPSSYKYESNVKDTLVKFCSDFYLKRIELLDCSVLTKPQKFLFKKGKLQ